MTAPEAETLYLVRQGKSQAALICAAPIGSSEREAVEQFAHLVKRSTGATLAIIPSADKLEPNTIRLYIGNSPEAAAAGIGDLPEESYRILRQGNTLFIVGHEASIPHADKPTSRPTLWALNRLLEEGLGVRWLWPGELGTYVPKQKDFPVTLQEIAYQPTLKIRSLRMRTRRNMALASTDATLDARLKEDALRWAENHQCGTRGNMHMSHAFTRWWDTYGQQHPEYFAELPPSYQQPHPKPERVKLRLSNPAVIEQIAAEYEAAGKPDYWNVCPNDSAAFDISDATRAWDLPLNQSIDDIFRGRANLTARYVEFWNRLHERLTRLNPDVTLVSFTYSSYRQPPPEERPLKARMVLGVVNSFDDYDAWKQWTKAGASLLLRPNWWYLGEDAPYLPLEKTTRYIQFASKNGMVGMDMDSIRGYWGTQGINYYLGARLMTRPELTLDEVLDEYTAAFGKGAAKIRDYIAYWQALTEQYNYQVVRQKSEAAAGAYGDLVREKKIPPSILNGSKPALVYLYTDEVLAPAYRLLDEAATAAGADDADARQRVEFLRRGLQSLEATRNQMKRSIDLRTTPSAEAEAAFISGAKELQQLREQFSSDHSTWGESSAYREHKHQIPLWPQYLKAKNLNLDGTL